MNEIGDALTGELELEPLLGLVARRLRTLIQARLVLIALPESGAEGLRIAAADGDGSDAYGLIGMELELGGSKTGRVLQRGRSERVDSVLDDPRSISRSLAEWEYGPRSTSHSSCAGGRSASSSRMTSWVRRRASPTTTSDSRSRSPRARRPPSTSPSG